MLIITFNLQASEKNIMKGNYQVGGSAQFTLFENNKYLSLAPRFEYFLIDKLSLGLNLSTGWSDNSSSTSHSYGIGPRLTYFFYEHSNWAFKIAEEIKVNRSKYDSNFYNLKAKYIDSTTVLGASYFFNSNVALGTELYYRHSWYDDTYNEENSTGVLVDFSIFL